MASSDWQAVAAHAAGLSEASDRISTVKPQKNETKQEDFNDYGRRIAARSAEITSLADKRQATAVAQALEGTRHACISCHLKFRRKNEENGFYPARGNTIYGEVKIVTLDGKEREDRSHIVVFLENVSKGSWHSSVIEKRPAVSQKDRLFLPRVLPVLRGAVVDFPNDDTVFHNVFSLSRTRPFDLDIYKPGTSKSVKFSKPGLVKTYCNIHPGMVCNILVLQNPFFTVTDSTGFYVITGVPDGRYPIRWWHEFGGETREEITASGSSLYGIPKVIQETKKTIRHKNKFGKPYRGKYR